MTETLLSKQLRYKSNQIQILRAEYTIVCTTGANIPPQIRSTPTVLLDKKSIRLTDRIVSIDKRLNRIGTRITIVRLTNEVINRASWLSKHRLKSRKGVPDKGPLTLSVHTSLFS